MTVLDPIGKLLSIFPEVNELIKKRSKKLLDYDRAKSSVKKLADKPTNDDPTKFPRVIKKLQIGFNKQAQEECNYTQNVYTEINTILVTNIPKLVDLRVPVLDPCFECLVKSNAAYNQACLEKLKGVDKGFKKHATMELDSIDNVLGRMRELTICK